MIIIILLLATCFLAFSNGANDNFKGVATLFGSKTANYKTAIVWATITTFAGSVCSIFLAEALIRNFSGQGLVPGHVAGSIEFLFAVSLGAACTVMLATQSGFPVSTTHGLIGALLGAGIMAAGNDVNFVRLGKVFFMPLLVSPSIAVILGASVYAIFRCMRVQMGVTKEWCICIGSKEEVIPIPQPKPGMLLSCVRTPDISLGKVSDCRQRYRGNILGFKCDGLLDAAHFLSAGVVSFARGLNDTPKIFALLLVVKMFQIEYGMLIVAVSMAAGGLLKARKVAETMSHKITQLNQGQGFAANVVTGLLVIFASRWGVPVSTTHVSCGALFGVGLITGQANRRVISQILLSWFLTLPVAIILSGMSYWMLTQFIPHL